MRVPEKRLALLALMGFVLYALPYLISTKTIVTDELGLDLFSTLVAESGQTAYVPEGDIIFGFPGFVPKQVVYGASGQAVPKQPPGFILLAALIKIITPDGFHVFLNPLLAALCILLFYDIARNIMDSSKAAFYAALLLATTPVFVHWSHMFFADMANLLAFLLALSCLQAGLKRPDTVRIVLLGFALGAMIWIRQTSFILLLPMCLYALTTRGRINPRFYVVPAGILVISITLLLRYNNNVYGNPFMTGYGVEDYMTSDRTLIEGISNTLKLAFQSQGLYLQRMQSFLPSFSLAFPPLVLALIGTYCALRSAEKRGFALFMICLFTVLFLLFAGRNTYGTIKYDMALQSSFLRYMLPIIALLPIPTLWALEKFKLATLRWICLIAFLNLAIATLANFGVIHTLLVRLYMEDVTEFVASNNAERSVVISPYWNHIIFPERIVYSLGKTEHDTLNTAIDSILSKGYNVIMINHQSDSEIFDAVENSQPSERIEGPTQLHPFLKILPVPIPSHVYPVTMLKISGISPVTSAGLPNGR